MKNRILVDTSIWIEYFNRPESKIGASLEVFIKKGNVCVTGLILTELLQGARIEKEFNAILESIIALPFLDVTLETWISAGKISFSLRRKGITLPTTDLIIASLAIAYDYSVFTLDPHFEKIPGIKLFKD
jgi:predicted nucleic acid-binding protein